MLKIYFRNNILKIQLNIIRNANQYLEWWLTDSKNRDVIENVDTIVSYDVHIRIFNSLLCTLKVFSRKNTNKNTTLYNKKKYDCYN